MNQTALTRALTKKFGLSHAESQRILRFLLDRIGQGLKAEKLVRLRDFGTFFQVVVPSRKIRNPKTGQPMTLPEKLTVRFHPSANLEKLQRD